MAVVNRKSTALTNATATPAVLNSPASGPNMLLEVAAVVATAADDTVASIGRFFRLPSNARVSELLLTNAASTAGAIDIGLYKADGAVVDADFFGSAVSLISALAEVDQKGESAVSYTTANTNKTLWELLALASDPNVEYDVAYTITTNFNAGPTAIMLKARYVV